jgi:hypothetical protein
MRNPRAVTPKTLTTSREQRPGETSPPGRKVGMPKGYRHSPAIKLRMSHAQRAYRKRTQKHKP